MSPSEWPLITVLDHKELHGAYAENHGKTLHSSHVRWFEVALAYRFQYFEVELKEHAYHGNKVLVLHLFYGDVVHKSGYDSPRPCLFPKIDFLVAFT